VNAGKVNYVNNYNLFGEVEELPDVVHCERIETRSKLHNWEFRPHRHAHLHQVLVLATGEGQASIEENRYSLSDETIINVPTGCVHGFEFTPNTHGWVLTVTSGLVDDMSLRDEEVRLALSKVSIASATPDIKRLIEEAFREYEGRNFARAHLLRSLSTAILGLVARAITHTQLAKSRTQSTALSKFHRFEALVEKHFQERLSINQYANLMAVSPTHLSRITRDAIGVPAAVFVTDRVMREAKRMLTFTSLPIADVCYELGYQDPAHFTKSFSKSVGCSPRSFRNRSGRSGQ
jgi:AraC family transcriptional activator of pobA